MTPAERTKESWAIQDVPREILGQLDGIDSATAGGRML